MKANQSVILVNATYGSNAICSYKLQLKKRKKERKCAQKKNVTKLKMKKVKGLQIELPLVVSTGDLDGMCGFDVLPTARNVETVPVCQTLWQLPPGYQLVIRML